MEENIEKQIEVLKKQQALKKQHEELIEVREKLLNDKADISIHAMVTLLTKLEDGVSELLEGMARKGDYYDKKLGETVKSSISEAVEAISKMKPPEVSVTPNINVDLKPLQSIAGEISNQNKNLLGLIEKINKGDNSQELYRLVVGMVKKHNEFLEGLKEIDYTKPLNGIGEALNKPKATEWEVVVTKRHPGGAFEKATITTVK